MAISFSKYQLLKDNSIRTHGSQNEFDSADHENLDEGVIKTIVDDGDGKAAQYIYRGNSWHKIADEDFIVTASGVKVLYESNDDTNEFSDDEKTKLDEIDDSANNYSHPANHDPSIITQDASNRFVTDGEKNTWNGKQADLGFTPEDSADKGSTNGYAELDGAGKVPSGQLPSFVDDVIEAANFAALPGSGEEGKIYVTLDDNKTYRWSGSVYVEISSSLALGEISTTAYRGDRGKTAYDHSQVAHSPSGAEVNVQSDWNAGSGDSLIINKPSLLAIGETSATAYRGDRGKTGYDHSQGSHAPSGAEVNVQSDWNAGSGDAQILNKPSVGIGDVVDDTTPQLGGDLDCNDQQILKASYAQIGDASLGTGTYTFNYANGDMQQLTATGSITLAASGFISGSVCCMIIDAINFGAYTISHPAAWLFAGGAAPTYTSAGTDRLILLKDKDDIYTLHVIGQDIKVV